jgi:hypothetical protein
MVETTLEIRFSADDTACVIVDSDAADEVAQQAELVSFGHYAARIMVLLGRERALPLVDTLRLLNEEAAEGLVDASGSDPPPLADIGGGPIRVARPDSPLRPDKAIQVVARFLDTRREPRMFFSLKAHAVRLEREGTRQALASVPVLLSSLLDRRAADTAYVRRLADTARLIGWLGANDEIVPGSEFDAALATADVAWRLSPSPAGSGDRDHGLQCPSCGNQGSTAPTSEAFEFRLWPSDRARIRKCRQCGTGLWLRAQRRPRTIEHGLWQAMEAIRDGLSASAAGTRSDTRSEAGQPEDSALLEDLKQVFAENQWPYSEVEGLPVLLSELSGPLGSWKLYAQAVEAQSLILMYSICPLRVPDERRFEMSHFLSLVNHGLAAGNFELDLDDGEIRYKTVVHLQGDEIDGLAVKRLVRANGLAMETYLPGIGAVITGMPAAVALERRTTE